MTDPIRYAAWLHNILAGYLWLITAVPLGAWNLQRGERLVPALLQGHGLGAEEVGTLVFISLPALLCWVAYRRRSIWVAGLTLTLDASWLWMQIQSWWVPYILGTPREWQIKYAQGPTTKLLPSFGQHLAPDGMHFVIQVLLVAALVMTVLGVRQLARRESGE